MKRFLQLFVAAALASATALADQLPPPAGFESQFGDTGFRSPGTVFGNPDAAPSAAGVQTTNNPANINQRNVTRKEDPKKNPRNQAGQGKKETPSMPSAGSPGSSDSGGEGSKGGGGGCTKGCQILGKDAADLKTAVSKLNGSDDDALKKLGASLEPYSVADQEAKAAIDRATLEMKKAKAAADEAASQLKTFADANKTDTEKIKKFAVDAEQKGKDAKECSSEDPGKADAPKGETSRSTKLPPGVAEKVKEARTAADAAQKAADELKAKAAQLKAGSTGKIGEISAMQSKLGKIAQDNKKLQELVQRASDNANQQYTENVEPTLKEVQEKVKALEEALTAAEKADPSAKTASKTATGVKGAMEGDNAKVAAGATPWSLAPDAAAKEKVCTGINPAVSDHKTQASKPKTPAETADKDADDAKTKAATAAEKKIREV